MTVAELGEILESTGFPVSFDAIDPDNELEVSQITLPYIIYRQTDSNTFSADNIVFWEKPVCAIYLYTAKKSIAAETTLKNALSGAGLYYSESGEQYYEEEKLYEVELQVEV